VVPPPVWRLLVLLVAVPTSTLLLPVAVALAHPPVLVRPGVMTPTPPGKSQNRRVILASTFSMTVGAKDADIRL
jgi:hypothetical protein